MKPAEATNEQGTPALVRVLDHLAFLDGLDLEEHERKALRDHAIRSFGKTTREEIRDML